MIYESLTSIKVIFVIVKPNMRLEILYSDYFQLYLYYGLLGIFLIQMIYFWGIFSNFSMLRCKKSNITIHQAVSIVICARNEYYHLEKNLPLILEQDYQDFEVVVVNDDSDDDTKDLLNEFNRKYKKLTVINFEKNKNIYKGKKFPLALGIKSAKNDLILLTDADCYPKDKSWINQMQYHFSKTQVKIVLGYGGYVALKGFLNKLIRFDTLMIALQYFSFAKIGIPYMGVGRNMAYRKSFFNEKKGFVNHYHISSGDDDMFVNQNATRKNTRIEFSREGQTLSEPKTEFSSWIFQKRRHVSTGQFYKFYHIILLVLFPLTTILFYSTSILMMVKYFNLYTIIVLFSLLFIRIISQLIITKKAMIKLNEKNLLFFAPFLEFYLLFINIFVVLKNWFTKENIWK